MSYRIEHDSMGEIKVPQDSLWGAQTQRSKKTLKLVREKMPIGVVHGLSPIKKICSNC